jgi:hypothetical protein
VRGPLINTNHPFKILFIPCGFDTSICPINPKQDRMMARISVRKNRHYMLDCKKPDAKERN